MAFFGINSGNHLFRGLILFLLCNFYLTGHLHAIWSPAGDSNMTYEKFESFLKELSDSSKYLVVPLNKYLETFDSTRIIIGLRHDVDIDLNKATEMARIEKRMGMKASYYFLHTAQYYYTNPSDTASRSDSLIKSMLTFQNGWGHEVGLHNDVLSLQLLYNVEPRQFLTNELKYLRNNGLHISGVASHGASQLRPLKCINYYFFEECDDKPFDVNFTNTNQVVLNEKDTVKLIKGTLKEFGFDYEAYFLNNNHYYSDVKLIKGSRWNMAVNDWRILKPGDRAIILIHPEHWNKTCDFAEFTEFSIQGQIGKSVIDPFLQTVNLTFPHGFECDSLVADYKLSPEPASVNIGKQPFISGVSLADFSKPVNFDIEPVDCKTLKHWKSVVNIIPNMHADIVKILVSKASTQPVIDYLNKSISFSVPEKYAKRKLRFDITASPYASVCYNGKLLKKKHLKVKATQPFIISVLSEDATVGTDWTIYPCYN